MGEETPASSRVMRVTGLQLSPVLQHPVYCGKGAESSELSLCEELKPPASLRTFDTDRQLGRGGGGGGWHGTGVGCKGLSPPILPKL